MRIDMTQSGTGFHIRAGGSRDLDALEPIWLGVHHLHGQVLPDLGPYVADAQSWQVRRRIYSDLLLRSDTDLWIAESANANIVGYSLGYILHEDERRWVDDTWDAGKLGEVESLGVLPEYRGRGVGRQLLGRILDSLEAHGAHGVVIGVVPTNVGAVELYGKYGFSPAFLYLARFARRFSESNVSSSP
jgi:ribosomal protein S18 acetylase RimI-like enzyme